MHLTINRKTHYDVTYFPADRMVESIKYQISFEKCRQIIFLTEFQRPTVFSMGRKTLCTYTSSVLSEPYHDLS